MDLSYHLPADIRNEFYVKSDGGIRAKSWAAVARLAGVKNSTLLDRLLPRVFNNPPEDLPITLKPLSGIDLRQSPEIDETTISCVVNYYAWESEQVTNNTAKHVAMIFNAIGIRAFFQNELGWKAPEPEKPIANNEDIMILLHTSRMLGQTITGNRGILCLIQEEDKFQTVAHLPLPTLPEPFSLRQWVKYAKSMDLSTPDCISLGKQVAAAMRTLKYKQPKVQMANQRRYSYPDMPVLETAWEGWRISRMRG